VRVAVVSDVHSNLHALEAVLAAIDAEGVDALWCLGDTVGYGPKPNECCTVVSARTSVCLAGNHDLVVLGTLDLENFAGDAAAAARWTQGVLSDDARSFLGRLEPQAEVDGAQVFHGSPRDPVWDYVLSEPVAWWSLRLTKAPLVLVGHSHVALALRPVDDGVAGGLAPAGTEIDLSHSRWLLNPGSVGQPRDGDARAAWLLLDLDANRANFRRNEYDIAATQAEMRNAELPPALVARLAHGE
jgi:predicted phosphodiesterase